MLLTCGRDVKVPRLKPVFQMRQEDHAQVYEALAAADVVFAQRISDEFKLDWLSTAVVRATFGTKTVVWPNVYFDGYFPGVGYIYHRPYGKLLSPLRDYHFLPLLHAYQAGRTVDEAIHLFAGEGIFDKVADPFGASLDQLRAREADCDVTISDHIAAQNRESRVFYTPNHPTNELLGEVLRRLTEAVGISADIPGGVAMRYRLDQIYIAASPAVVRRYGLGFDRETRYRGCAVESVSEQAVQLGAAQEYDLRALTEAFYRIYYAAFPGGSRATCAAA